MKERHSIDRFGVNHYEYWDNDIDQEILTKAVERLVKRGMGATVGDTTYGISRDLAKYIAEENGHTNRPIDALIHGHYEYGKLILPQIEKELSKHFYNIETTYNTYWFPNGVSKNRAHKWLNDDFIGTMENPA